MAQGKFRHIKAGWLIAASLVATIGGMGFALPAKAQIATVEEIRLRKIEADVRAMQRQVAPTMNGGSGTSATDQLARMDAIEAQLARLTAQNEEIANRQRQIEAKLGMGDAATKPAASTTAPAPAPLVSEKPVASTTAKPLKPLTTDKAAEKPTVTTKPSAQRMAAVKAIIKPVTTDPADDEYSYGFRLYDAKFYPEAQQQLKLYVDKYPKHARISNAMNLLGRAYMDEGKPKEGAAWFVQNFNSNKSGVRAADSLLNLAEAMLQLKDTTRACIALGEFGERYAAEAKGRLKGQYDSVRSEVNCN